MRVRLFPALLAIGLALASRAHACSQCMCGTPFPADALGGVVPMQIRYGIEDRYLSKSNGLEDGPGTEREREHRVSVFALWRAADRLAVLGRLPYNVKQIRESPAGGQATLEEESGLGDAEVSALVGLTHTTGRYPKVLGLVLGATAPTGSNEQRDDAGERRDAHLQPGTGAWSGTGGLSFAVSVGDGVVDASILDRVNGTSSQGYRYGNVLLFNTGYASSRRHELRLLAQINGRRARRDQLEGGGIGENTGGTVVYVSPGVRWQSESGLDIEAAVQIPVIESLFGDQDEHTTGRLTLSLSR